MKNKDENVISAVVLHRYGFFFIYKYYVSSHIIWKQSDKPQNQENKLRTFEFGEEKKI